MPDDEQQTQAPPPTEDKPVESATPPADEVQEVEGETIAPTDPQAAAKWVKREQRLVRERNAARDELKTLREQQQTKEQQMADQQEQKTAEQLAGVTKERDDARAEIEHLKLEKELGGKVLDPDSAIKLMGGGYRKQDGTVDVDAFLEKHPYMKPAASPTAPGGAGGTHTGTGKDDEIAKVQEQLAEAEKRGNRPLAVSLQSKLTELRRTTGS